MNSKQRNILLLVIFILSFLSILLIKFIFQNVPEIFESGSEVGEVIYDLSLAYIAAYLFYQIVVASPKRADLKNIYTHAKWLSYDIAYKGSSIINPKSGIEDPNYDPFLIRNLSEEDFTKFCKENKITDTYTVFWTKDVFDLISYGQHLKKTQDRVLEKIEESFRFHSHLETEHIKLLNDIKNCPFMTYGRHYLEDFDLSKNKPDLLHLDFVLFDFYQKTIKLHNYIKQLKV